MCGVIGIERITNVFNSEQQSVDLIKITYLKEILDALIKLCVSGLVL